MAAQTEGWPVAVYLAARAASDGGDIDEVGGKDWVIADYLRREFLDQQSPEVRRFLVDSSVLAELSAPLCDFVLERTDSAAVIDQIEQSTLLLVPLDTERSWFRYHRLLRGVLLSEAQRGGRELSDQRRARAAMWSEGNGLVERAVAYAQDANDGDEVAALVIRHGMRMYAGGRAEVLDPWFAWLWDSGCRDPRVAVMCAWLLLLRGGETRARWCLALAEEGDPAIEFPDGSPVGAWTSSLNAALADNAAIMRRESETALALVGQNGRLRPTTLTLLGFALYLAGSSNEADDVFREATELSEHLGTAGSGISAHGGRCLIAMESGRWGDAERLAEAANALIAASGMADYAGSALIRGVNAQLTVRRQDTESALHEAAEAADLLTFVSDHVFAFAVATRLLIARTLLDVGEVAEASECRCEA